MDELNLRSRLNETFELEPASEADFERVRRRARMRPARQAGTVVGVAATLAVAVLAVQVPFRGFGRGGPGDGGTAPTRPETLDIRAAAAVMQRVQSSVAEQETFEISTTVVSTVEREGLSASERFRMTGDVDLGAELAELTMKLDSPSSGQSLRPCTFVAAPDAVYFRIPDARRASFGDREWLVQGADQTGPEPGRVGSLDPRAHLDLLSGVVELEPAGTADIDGVETTHYRGHIDLGRLSDGGPFTNFDRRTAVEIWVDEDDLPRRVVQRFGATDAATGTNVSLVYTGEYSGFGSAADVDAPAPDTVAADTGEDALAVCLGAASS